MKRIDKNRAMIREMVAGDRWGNRSSYELTVNTTNWDLKTLAPIVADFAQKYFARP